jgi:hypothetical protein
MSIHLLLPEHMASFPRRLLYSQHWNSLKSDIYCKSSNRRETEKKLLLTGNTNKPDLIRLGVESYLRC